MLVALREYEHEDAVLPDRAVSDLVLAAGDRLRVGATAVPGTVRITASSYVGTIVTPDVEVRVRPKVPLENLFLMLDVGLPPDAWRAETALFGTDRDLLPAVALFFARTLERTLASGLLRSYRSENDRLVALRGRIDLPAQLRHPGLETPIACAFEEYTADIIENRYLKSAVRRLLRVPRVSGIARRGLLQQLARFEEVAGVSVEPDATDRMHFTRINQHYRPSLRLARIVLENLTLTDREGSAPSTSFMIDMNDLFQRFLADRLRRALHGTLRVVEEPTTYLDVEQQVRMYPDLVFSRNGRTVYVGDAKYKLSDSGLARNADYYQLLAYTTALGLPAGILVYCQADGEEPARSITTIRAGKRLVTYPLDLSGPCMAVEASVVRLASAIIASCVPVPSRSNSAMSPTVLGADVRLTPTESAGRISPLAAQSTAS